MDTVNHEIFFFQLMSNHKNTVREFKRLIGRNYDDPFVQKELPNLPYSVVRNEDGSIGIKVSITLLMHIVRANEMAPQWRFVRD